MPCRSALILALGLFLRSSECLKLQAEMAPERSFAGQAHRQWPGMYPTPFAGQRQSWGASEEHVEAQEQEREPQQMVEEQVQKPYAGWFHDEYGFHPPAGRISSHKVVAKADYAGGENKDYSRNQIALERSTANNIFPYMVDSGCWTTRRWRQVQKRSAECNTASFSVPEESRFVEMGNNDTSNLPWDLVDQGASHIYFLCADCSKDVKLPTQWRGKVTIVDGKKSDECLGTEDEQHNIKVTIGHKLLVTDAKANNYTTIAIIEDDFAMTSYHGYANDDMDKMKNFAKSADWEMIRLAWRWMAPLYGKSHASYNECRKECVCTKSAESQNMCVVNKGCEDITSSSSYLVSSSGYDTMLATGGCIDNTVMGNLKSTLMVPTMLVQRGHHDEILEESFTKNCVRD